MLLGQLAVPIQPSRMTELFVEDEQRLAAAALDKSEVSPRHLGDFFCPFCHLLLFPPLDLIGGSRPKLGHLRRLSTFGPALRTAPERQSAIRSEERRVGKECRSRW